MLQVLSPLIDEGQITVQGSIASELQDWSAALSRRRLPLEIQVVGQGVESQQELIAKIRLLQEPDGPAYYSAKEACA